MLPYLLECHRHSLGCHIYTDYQYYIHIVHANNNMTYNHTVFLDMYIKVGKSATKYNNYRLILGGGVLGG